MAASATSSKAGSSSDSGTDLSSEVDIQVSRHEKKSISHHLGRAQKAGAQPLRVTPRTAYSNRIVGNWDCFVKDSLPIELHPRPLGSHGRRVALQQPDKKRLPPESWSLGFLRILAKLSTVMMYDRAAAHKRLKAIVKKRQNTMVHPEYYAREVLTSDIAALTATIRDLIKRGNYKTKKHASLPPAKPGKRGIHLSAKASSVLASTKSNQKRKQEGEKARSVKLSAKPDNKRE